MLRPEYLLRPTQVVRRLHAMLSPRGGLIQVTLPWGAALVVDQADAMGWAIVTTGVYDLPLSEALWRLTAADDVAVDAGANVGYTSSLLALRAAAVHAFEPHPLLARSLRDNRARWEHGARVQVHEVALSSATGWATLAEGAAFERNRGTAAITSSGAGFTVRTVALDDAVPDRIGVLKVDVEGHEAAVLNGAQAHLAARTIRDIAYEDHAGYPSDVSRLLEGAGYAIMRLERGRLGPRLVHPAAPRPRVMTEPSNYLATVAIARAVQLLAPRGWRVLRATPPTEYRRV